MSIPQASPTPSPTPIVSAPSVASSQSWNGAPSNVAMPSATQPSAPADYWAAAYQALANQGAPTGLAPQSAPTPMPWSPVSAEPWASTQPSLTPQQQANWGVPAGWAAPVAQAPAALMPSAAPSAQPIYWPPAMPASPAPNFSPAALQQYQQAAQAATAQPAVGDLGDRYLNGLSSDSLEVLAHFGTEAPVKLNTYACTIEDALLESLGEQRTQAELIGDYAAYVQELLPILQGLEQQSEAMRLLLTDPDQLAEYTAGFFGPNGPAPVMTPAEQAQAALQQGMVQSGGPLMERADPYAMIPPEMQAAMQRGEVVFPGAEYAQAAPQRPAQSMPQPAGMMAGSRGELWGAFSQAMDARPQAAWQVLDQMPADVLRSKILFMDS